VERSKDKMKKECKVEITEERWTIKGQKEGR
jgi:hypothetical protein